MSLPPIRAAGSESMPPIVTLCEAAPDPLSPSDLLWGSAPGHVVLGGGRRIERTTRLRLHGPPEEQDGRLATLAGIFADTSYVSDTVVGARVNDVTIDLTYGVVMRQDGSVLSETTTVARLYPQWRANLDSLPSRVGEGNVFGAPLLHAFHRSSGAYGHFVFDVLVTLQEFLQPIRAGRLWVLVPPYVPRWVLPIMEAIGIPASAVHMPGGLAIHCAQVVVPSSIQGFTTYKSDRVRCERLRDMLVPRLKVGSRRRHIYLSRANQASHWQRTTKNEAAVAEMLAARGFEVLAPGNMPFVEQVRAFAEAKIIVAAHGSAFGNLVFAGPGTAVVDLMPADWVGFWPHSGGSVERWLLDATSMLGLDYDVVLCRSRLVRILPEEDTSGAQKMGMESEVDLDLLARVLDGQRAPDAVAVAPGPAEESGAAPHPDAVDALCDPRLTAPFRRPERIGTSSAWWGHVPFAAWLVEAARPRCLVELGSLGGVSFFNFCQSVQAAGMDCRCHAVDTWRGDAHAGLYGDEVHAEFRELVERRYPAIAEMHRCTFDEAVARFADGSIDILHIDGLHTYDAVRHDFETWLPKMSDRGIVLFHDTNEQRDDFGVWQFWAEVSARWPAFEFLHSHGLGVLCVGPNAPEPVLALCRADAARVALLRERFTVLGDAATAKTERETAASAFAAEATRRVEAESQLAAIQASTAWRATTPLRTVGTYFPRTVRLLRRGLRVLWWTLTLQLPARLKARGAARSGGRG